MQGATSAVLKPGRNDDKEVHEFGVGPGRELYRTVRLEERSPTQAKQRQKNARHGQTNAKQTLARERRQTCAIFQLLRGAAAVAIASVSVLAFSRCSRVFSPMLYSLLEMSCSCGW